MATNERLNIPAKLKVGYQKRTDTYSGKLAYVTYINQKGKIAKEVSWTGWIKKENGIDDFENIPTEGFVLNKKVGDYSSGWDHRMSYCRVYDPRGFEIEISIDNLLYILQECTSTKGKGLEGEFVYAWDRADLVLLPVCSPDYKATVDLVNKTEKITGKNLIVGASYKAKDSENLIFLGKIDFGENQVRGYKSWSGKAYGRENHGKKFCFYAEEEKKFFTYSSINGKVDYLKDEKAMTADEVEDRLDILRSNYAFRGDNGIKKLLINVEACCRSESTLEEMHEDIHRAAHHYIHYAKRIGDKEIEIYTPETDYCIDGMNKEEYLDYLCLNDRNIRETFKAKRNGYGYYYGWRESEGRKYIESKGYDYEALMKKIEDKYSAFDKEAKKTLRGLHLSFKYRVVDGRPVMSYVRNENERSNYYWCTSGPDYDFVEKTKYSLKEINPSELMGPFYNTYDCEWVEYEDGFKAKVSEYLYVNDKNYTKLI